jgi:hypothetical protein
MTGVQYERRQLLSFVEACWPLIQDDPSPVRGAEEFVAGGALVMC